MGNTKSTTCSNKTSVSEQDLLLSDYDLTIYEYRKERIFKGTISICIFYAFIALLILVTSYLFPNIKYVIFDKFLPFTIVFIIGTILLILYLFYNILNFKPIKINKNFDYTNISCPDYWKLEYDENLYKFFDSNTINTNIFNYRCVLDSNIFSKTDLYFNRKNQLGNSDATGSTAIGMTGSTYNKLTTYENVNKDEIDTNKQKYIVADIKDVGNNNIINKITGNFDSNVYKTLVESSLLMNNYIFDADASKTGEYNIYKHISKDSLKAGDYTNNKDTSNIYVVNSDTMKDTGSTSKITEDYRIKIKKYITDNTSTYLDNIKFNTNAASAVDTDLEKVPLVCNRVYPLLMAAKDKELSKNSNGKYDENILRCAYSKMCGIPWSDMNCDKYNT